MTAEVYLAAGRLMADAGRLAGRRRRGRLLAGVRQQRGGARDRWCARSSAPASCRAGRRDLARHRRLRVRRATAATGSASSRASSTATAWCELLLGWCRALSHRLDRGSAGRGRRRRACDRFTAAVGDRVQVIGDDFLVTNAERIAAGRRRAARVQRGAGQGQPGRHGHARPRPRSHAAKAAGFGTIVSARSGETEDVTIAHLAVGWNAGQFKVGSFARSERMAKWNEVIRIEQALGSNARFAGCSWMPGARGPRGTSSA